MNENNNNSMNENLNENFNNNSNNSMNNNSMNKNYNEINNNNNNSSKNYNEENDFNTNNTMIQNNIQKKENKFEFSLENDLNSMIKIEKKKKNKKNEKKKKQKKINIKNEIENEEIINNISKINNLFHIDLNTKIFRICFEEDFNIFPKPLSTNELLNLYKNNIINIKNTTFCLIDYFKFKNCEPFIYKKLEIIKDENWVENIEKNNFNFFIENNKNENENLINNNLNNNNNINENLINENSLLNAIKDETIVFNESILPKNNFDEKFENFHRNKELENNWKEIKRKKNKNKKEEINVVINKPGLKKNNDKKNKNKNKFK